MSDEHEHLLDTQAAADLLGLSYDWLVKARQAHTGPKFIRIGRAIRYSKAALLDFIQKNTHT